MRKTSGAWDSELGVCDRGSRCAKLLSNSAACRWKRSSARDPRETFTLILLHFDFCVESLELRMFRKASLSIRYRSYRLFSGGHYITGIVVLRMTLYYR